MQMLKKLLVFCGGLWLIFELLNCFIVELLNVTEIGFLSTI